MSGEGELKMNEKFEKSAVVLLDIAGTTSSICFVENTLFPFVLNNAEKVLNEKWEDSELQETIKSLGDTETAIVKDGEKDAILKSVLDVLKDLTEKKSTVEAFKSLQGHIYKHGYGSGELKGHVFNDVATSLPAWANAKRVCIFSSGDSKAQQLLFAHSTEGDLSAHITDYFDQSVGKKTEASSYKKIAEKLTCKTEEIIFLTDSVTEAKAAGEAGVYPVLVSREGNEEISEDDRKLYAVIKSFAELGQEASAKRKITEEPEQEAPPAKVAKTDVEKTDEANAQSTSSAEKPQASNEDEKMEVDTEPAVKEKVDEKPTEKEVVTSTSAEEQKAPEEKKSSEEPAAKAEEADKEAEAAKDVSSSEAQATEVKDKDKVVKESLPEEKSEAVAETKTEPAEKETKETPTKAEAEAPKEQPVEQKNTEKDTTTTEAVASTDKEEAVKDEKTPEVEEPAADAKKDASAPEPAEKVEEEKKETEAEETKKEESAAADKTEAPAAAADGAGDAEAGEASKNGDVVENGAGAGAGAAGDAAAAATDEPKKTTAEKENKSELANGAHIENGEEGEAAAPEPEIKVKKLEGESGDSENVSVEVKA